MCVLYIYFSLKKFLNYNRFCMLYSYNYCFVFMHVLILCVSINSVFLFTTHILYLYLSIYIATIIWNIYIIYSWWYYYKKRYCSVILMLIACRKEIKIRFNGSSGVPISIDLVYHKYRFKGYSY